MKQNLFISFSSAYGHWLVEEWESVHVPSLKQASEHNGIIVLVDCQTAKAMRVL